MKSFNLLEGLRSGVPGARAMRMFTLATLVPVALVLLGVAFGGVAAAAALVFISPIIWLLDRFSARAAPFVPGADEFPAAEGLSVLLAVLHLTVLPFMVWALSGAAGLSWTEGALLFLAFGLWLGQVSNSNAHELIHRKVPRLRGLGVAVYASVGYGHHVSAHRLVHHRFVATQDDPNTARRGESFYHFVLRAWPAEFLAGRAMEDHLSARLTRKRLHPYVLYLGGAGLAAIVALLLAGFDGVLVWLALSAYAQLQLMLSDYVQHYGLLRAKEPGGKSEPVGPQHSWDAGHWASSALMLNAPRHADHHAHPARIYPALELPQGGLRLPYSLPFMAMLALIPPLWFRVMDRRLPAAPETVARFRF